MSVDLSVAGVWVLIILTVVSLGYAAMIRLELEETRGALTELRNTDPYAKLSAEKATVRHLRSKVDRRDATIAELRRALADERLSTLLHEVRHPDLAG